jgi:hypothetical protein
MKRFLIALILLIPIATQLQGQSLDDLNIQIHGYATQGFLYTTQNNIFTTSSSDGSPAWSEAVVNVTSQPDPKLRIGVQARYFLLGNFGNSITLDWAAADYKFNDKFGVRFGKVKTPSSLFNETQDIDPSYIWALMPQSIYSIVSRNSVLSHYGGIVYGTLKLGENLGKFEYRGWGGERAINSTDGYLLASSEKGIVAPNGVSGAMYGAALNWKTPLPGFKVGATYQIQKPRTGAITYTTSKGLTYTGNMNRTEIDAPDFYAQYEKDRIMVAAEYTKKGTYSEIDTLTAGPAPIPTIKNVLTDQINWYGMATYKLTNKLTAGLYDSQYINRATAFSTTGARFSKDWAVSGRYDFNQFLYAKAEQHFIDGTAVVYDTNLNPNGLKPTTKLTILKIGVSF